MNPKLAKFSWARFARWQVALEAVLLIGIAFLFAHPILSFDPQVIPIGNEYGLSLESHVIWEQVQRCGLCFLWNGMLNGGYPAFVDLHGAPLHPVTIFATLLFGLPNSGRVIFFVSLLIAAFAQWWMGYTLGLSRVARVWMAAMALMGGHLAAKLQMGVITLVLSIACASLVLAAFLHWIYHPSTRSAILLAWTIVLLGLSGQGYTQLITFTVILPCLFAVFFPRRRSDRVAAHIPLIVGLSLAMLAVFWVPFVHFMPNFGKDGEINFESAQILEYAPLNWVIADRAFFDLSALNTMAGFAYLYWNYIGWGAVILAIVGLFGAADNRRHLRLRVGVALAIWLIFLATHQPFLQSVARYVQMVFVLRNPAVMTSMTTPLLLLLSGLGADFLYKTVHLRLVLRYADKQQSFYVQKWLTLLLLLWSLLSVYRVNQFWLTQSLDLRNHAIWQILKSLKSGDSQWVYVPQSEHFYKLYAAEYGLKYTTAVMPWFWKEQQQPLPYRKIIPITQVMPNETELQRFDDNISVMVKPDPLPYYAYVLNEEGEVPCMAQADGGLIIVDCLLETAGTLFVTENPISGWRAELDGQRALTVLESQWLAVEIPQGQHQVIFRYLPWDVAIGFTITLLGVAASLFGWFYSETAFLQRIAHTLKQFRVDVRLSLEVNR